jgi:hypothetical protein
MLEAMNMTTWEATSRLENPLETPTELESPGALGIVWRNPNPVPVYQRRHNSEHTQERDLYTLQEFIQDGDLSYWVTISSLEVVEGGAAA